MTTEQLLVIFVQAKQGNDALLDMITDCFYDAPERDWLLWTESLAHDFDEHKIRAFALLFGLTPNKVLLIIDKYNELVSHAYEEFT